ncbi:hydroxyphenylacetyl-CoA thioesterase PaaI [Salibacterium salarium]|uniref:Hydroxyphenylacetyl-CoA thioesterase PaaI n=1 Tax=Salibacterium salarium TaxID=284579 RepID=A0A428MTJ8_9BACI|nr:hydroxyphenylacetyl-CoA thioesterase PaaI [Salibacterium salarium]RSL29453.1 hydroxyphenylacetyl-CoA thioesterase PaaI [Salibacterium salarium]
MTTSLKEYFQQDSFANHLGICIEELNHGFATVSMKVTEDMLNFHKSANGGAIFSLADAAFACASNSHGQTAVGVNVSIHFVDAAAAGDTLTAIAKEDNKSYKLGLYRIEVYNQHDTLIALAEGLVYRKKEQFIDSEQLLSQRST